jgi:hypothetical protein
MRKKVILPFGAAIGALLLATALSAPRAAGAAPAAGGQRSDFALFDGTNPTAGETGMACGAKLGSSNNVVPFTYYVAVSNWSTEMKVLRVQYADGDMARYQIPAGTSFSLSQAAGGTAGVDDLIKVFAEGASPSGLAGSMSILTVAAAKPHPSLGANFCVTLTTPAP